MVDIHIVKIFMMLEAKKKGFDKVIWIDACCIAINNLDNIFLIFCLIK